MKKLSIENKGLTGYYLEEKFVDDPGRFNEESEVIEGDKESELMFIPDRTGETGGEIELHYKDEEDLEKKISYILMMLTDK